MEQHFNLTAWVDRRRRSLEAREEQAIGDHLANCETCRQLDELASHIGRIAAKHKPEKPRAVTTACPEVETLGLYFAGELPFFQKRELERHLANCHDCRVALARQIRLEADTVTPEDEKLEVQTLVDADQHVKKLAQRPELNAAAQSASSGFADLRSRGLSLVSYLRDVLDEVLHVAPRYAAAFTVFLVISFVGGRSFMLWRSNSLAAAGLQNLEKHQDISRDGFRLKGNFMPAISQTRGEGESDPGQQTAATQFEKSLWWNDDNREAKRGRALALFFAGDFAASQNLLSELLDGEPNNPIILNDLGAVAAAENEEEAALRYFEKALQINPEFVEARFNHAAVLQKLNRFEEAQAAWKRYAELQDTAAWRDVAEERKSEFADSQNF